MNSEKEGATSSDNGRTEAASIFPSALGSNIIFSVFGAVIAAQGMLSFYSGVSSTPPRSFFQAANITIWLTFCTFIVTIARFYHGNSIYHRRAFERYRRIASTLPRRGIRFLGDFYFTLVELIAFVFLASSVGGPPKLSGALASVGPETSLIGFMAAMLVLAVIDLVWQGLVVILSRRDEKEDLTRSTSELWVLLDILALIVTAVLLFLTVQEDWHAKAIQGVWVAAILFGVFMVASVVDYWQNAKFYFET